MIGLLVLLVVLVVGLAYGLQCSHPGREQLTKSCNGQATFRCKSCGECFMDYV